MQIEKLEPITRHDHTLLGRIYPVVESMAVITLVNALMMARGYNNVLSGKKQVARNLIFLSI